MKYLGKSMEALARKINNYLYRDILSRKCARGMPWKVVKMGKHFAKKKNDTSTCTKYLRLLSTLQKNKKLRTSTCPVL